MRWVLVLILLGIVANIGSVAALDIEQYGVEYNVLTTGEVEESLDIVFTTPLESSIQNTLNLGEANEIKVFADSQEIEIETSQVGDSVNVIFTTPPGTKELKISFVAKSLVFMGSGIYQFFTELTPPGGIEKINIKVILPKGFVIFRDIYFPSGAEIGTDGEIIFLSWEFQDNDGSIPISVQFEPVFKTNDFIIPAVVVIAMAAVVIIFFFYKRKGKQQFLMTFFEDERKVIIALQNEKVSYQNTIERKFGFSRAKMTRIVQKLERKGLLKKEKAGRTNRLHWKGLKTHKNR